MELQSVLLIILAIFIAYFVFLYFTQTKDVPANDAIMTPPMPVVESVERAPVQQMQPPIQQREAPSDAEQMGEEAPLDPYAEDQEHAEMPERMRKPERMFRPAPDNDGMPVNSGLMGAPHSGVGGYASEMVQNEGEFMPGIFAFDTSAEGGNFSMF